MRRTGQLTRRLLGVLLVAIAPALPGQADAGEKDTAAIVAIAEGMTEYLEGRTPEAVKKLEDALKGCAKVCEPSTRAQIHFNLGIVYGLGEKNLDKARTAFEQALREDPKLVPDRQFMEKELDKPFAEARANVRKGAGAPQPARPQPTKEQMAAVAAARAQLAQRDWSSCMGTLIAAMAESEFAAGKLTLARCQDTGGLILEALADAQLAVKYAEEELNAEVGQQAAQLVQKLENDMPTITLVIPKAVSKPEVTVDGVPVPADMIDKPIPHNPGKATIQVKGKRGLYPFSFKSTETMERGEKIAVTAEQVDTSPLQQCINAARTAADLQVCIETGGKGRGLTFRGGFEFMTYNDTTHVDVIAPSLALSLENPTSGWRVGGSFVVDVVTAASPDIVATASRRFDQTRVGGSLAGEYKIGAAKVGLNGELSVESDYVARGLGASVSADLVDKRVTPTLAYGIGFDTLGRGDTPFDVYAQDLMRHTVDAGVSVILNPSTVVVGGGTAQFELGDQSKPYRYIPMFTGDIAGRLPRGATPRLVGAEREPVAPLERLPDTRSRVAIFGRASHRFEAVTVRGDERLYIDSWGLKASTTDARLFWDVTNQLRVGPHVRFHIQGPVDFWQRGYAAKLTPKGWQLPKYRTGDRELGPLFGLTGGGGARYQLSENLAASVQVEGVYTQFLDHIYVYDRLGIFTATVLEMEVE